MNRLNVSMRMMGLTGAIVLSVIAQGCPLLSTASQPYKFTVNGTITSIDTTGGLVPAGVQVGDAFTATFIVDLLKPPVSAFFFPSFVAVTNDPENNLEVRIYHSEYVSSSFDPLLDAWGVAPQTGRASMSTEGDLSINGKPYTYGQVHASDMSFTSVQKKVKDWDTGTTVAMQFQVWQDYEADDPGAIIQSSNTVITAIEAL